MISWPLHISPRSTHMAAALLRATRDKVQPRITAADLGVVLDFGLDAEDDSTVRKLRAHLER